MSKGKQPLAAIEDCPHCGEYHGELMSKPENRHKGYFNVTYFVECSSCEARGPMHDKPEQAIAGWNRRYPVITET